MYKILNMDFKPDVIVIGNKNVQISPKLIIFPEVVNIMELIRSLPQIHLARFEKYIHVQFRKQHIFDTECCDLHRCLEKSFESQVIFIILACYYFCV